MLNVVPANSFDRFLQDARQAALDGRWPDARALFEHAHALAPDRLEALDGLSLAWLRLNRPDEAAAVLERIVQSHPSLAGAHANLGLARILAGQPERALDPLQTATRLDPAHAAAHLNLGLAQFRLGLHTAAAESFRNAVARDPASELARQNLVLALAAAARTGEAIAAARQAVADLPASAALHSGLLLTLHNDPAIHPHDLFAEHQRWAARHAAGIAPLQLPEPDLAPDRPLRVGYVSPDFRRHPVAEFFEPLLAAHDPRAVETFCYASVQHPDDVTARLRQRAHWRDIHPLSDTDAAALVRNDRIDILVDLAGHTAGNRLLLFARRPAPIQLTWLGYPNTTGLSAIDYRLTDSLVDPPNTTDALCTEQLLRLESPFLCYQPPHDAPAVAPLPAADGRPLTFGCFGAAGKWNPPLLELWAQVLHALPASRLVLKNTAFSDEPARSAVRRFFADRRLDPERLDPERLDLRPPSPDRRAHLAAYADVDIALDTFPYHGVTTTCEALWMGVPVITLAGNAHHARVGVSLLQSLGLGDLIAHDRPEFVAIAQRLASDIPRLAELRRNLRARMAASPLLSAEGFARRIEAAYRDLWRRYRPRPPAR